MAQNSFRPHKGKWSMKKVVLTASVAAVEKGDLIGIAALNDAAKALATTTSAAIVGIAAQDSATSAAVRDLYVWVPRDLGSLMKGKITAGVAVVGTDVDRPCDATDHEGAAVDTRAHGHLLLVDVTVACAACGTTAGEGTFRIIKLPEYADLDICASA